MKRETLRALASLAVGLVVLLTLEWPALAYPSTPESEPQVAPTGVQHRLPTSLLDAGVPRVSALAVRTAAGVATESGDESAWEPTKPEGAVFTVLGTSTVCAGTAVFIIGMAKLMPIVAEFGGLVTAAVGPLILAGVGLTLLFVGIPLLIHGLKALKAVQSAEPAAATTAALHSDTREPSRVVLLRF